MRHMAIDQPRVLAVVVGALAITLAGCGGATPHYAITPAQALTVFNTYNHNNQKANATLNMTLQNQQETSTAAEIDDATYQEYRYLGKTWYGSNAVLLKPPFAIYDFNESAATLAAGGTAYFVAIPGTTKKPRTLLLFAKTSARGAWKVFSEPSLAAGPNPAFIPAGNGYVEAGPLPSHLVASPTSALGDLIAYFGAYSTTSPSLGVLSPGPNTTGLLGTYKSTVANAASKNETDLLSFSQDSAPVVSFPVKGGALTFGAYDLTQTFTWPPNAEVIQPATRANWTPLLAPGTYHISVTINSVVEVVLLIPTKGQVSVLGTYGGMVSALGQ